MTLRGSNAPAPTAREALVYLGRLAVLMRPYWRDLIKGLALGIVIGALGLVTPYLTKLFVDEVYPSRSVDLLHVLVVAVAGISIATAFMGAVRGYFSQLVTARLGTAATLMFFNHLQHLPVRFFDDRRVGEVMSRFGDVRGSLNAVSGVVQTLLVSGVYLVLVPPLLLAINWRLALLSLATIPVTTTISGITGRVVRKYWKQSAEAAAELSGLQVEAFSQIRTVKTMAAEHEMLAAARRQSEHVLRTQLTATGLGTIVGVANGVIRTAGTAAFTWYGWTLILHGELTLGGFLAFTAYMGYVTGPVSQVAGLFTSFQQTAVTLGRVFEYLDQEPEQDPAPAWAAPAPITHRIGGDIVLRDVSFSYEPGRPAVRGVSVTLSPGSVTAIVGPSGAGKTSMLRVLCRMVEPDAGEVTIGGASLSRIPLRDLRRQISVVWQEFSLMRGTVWENLTFGVGEVSRAEVDEAVRICRLEELVRDLPDGYDTPVAEWGATLSGGQRQRFALARGLLRDAPVLLLDEAMSQIDTRTEDEILRALLVRQRASTVVLVTHRLASAALADHICVLDAGRITAVGTHRELLATSETYQDLVHAAGLDAGSRHLRVLGTP